MLAIIVFQRPTKIWRMRRGLGIFLLSLGSFQNGELWLEDSTGDVPLFVPKLGRSIAGRLIDAHDKPFEFDPKLWHGSTQWQGDRWVLIAYSLPAVSHEVLVDLNFPLRIRFRVIRWLARHATLMHFHLRCPRTLCHCRITRNFFLIFAQVHRPLWHQRLLPGGSRHCQLISWWIQRMICCRIAFLSNCFGWRLLAVLRLRMQALLAQNTVG